MKWIGPVAGLVLITCCFIPWVYIESKGIVITGVESTGTNFGKPAYFHLAMVFFFLLFVFLPRVWAKRANLVVTALNLAWAIRNYFIITTCMGGDCPAKKTGIYLLVLASVLMLIAALFPSMKLGERKIAG
jgi:hypothetical protein